MTTTPAPHWDLTNVFPSLESSEYEAAVGGAKEQVDFLEKHFAEKIAPSNTQTPVNELADIAGETLERLNTLFETTGTIRAYIQSFVTTNSRDKLAMRKMSEFEQVGVRIHNLATQFQAWLGQLTPVLDALINSNPNAAAHTFFLKDSAEQSRYMMSAAEESLAAQLNLSGASAWMKLQGTLTSQLSVEFELDGQTQKLPMPALINLHSHPDESVRRRAYEAEMQAWKTIEEALAAAMNGIKGTSNTLNQRRGRIDALHPAIDDARIDRQTLEAMHDSFPMFRRYFNAKARRLGKQKLAWWDVFAPVGASNKTFTWEQTRDFVLENFATFSPRLAEMAKTAFEKNWIDAEQRDGKRGGAFCMKVPAVKESRILCNFDGTLDQIGTIAHELGHAFHNECAFSAGKTILQQDTPMTLAETASIMCETIVMEAILKQTSDPQEQLAILETSLIGDAQVIVDIYSRYLFEKEVFERRASAELSADELNEIMENAQKSTYGDGVDERYLMKYMWTWKPHYYSADRPFYNFPYAFGLLFAIGLYAIYQRRGAAFVQDYTDLLASTGEAPAAELAQRFGINIREKQFWADSLGIIARKIERYEQL